MLNKQIPINHQLKNTLKRKHPIKAIKKRYPAKSVIKSSPNFGDSSTNPHREKQSVVLEHIFIKLNELKPSLSKISENFLTAIH